MQVSKFLLTVCATAVCAGFISFLAQAAPVPVAPSQDTPAQAAARAALMAAMGSPSAPAEQTKSAPAMVESPGVVAEQTNPPAQTNQIATPQPAPVAAAPAAQTPAMAPPSSDNEAQALAREALMQKMGQQPAETPAPMAPVAPMTPVTPSQTIAVTPPTPAAAPSSSDAATQAVVARETLLQKMATQPYVASPNNASNANYPGREPGFAPIIAPPLPISAAKEQQLDALLAQYMADQISPEQYHKQRAAILAEP